MNAGLKKKFRVLPKKLNLHKFRRSPPAHREFALYLTSAAVPEPIAEIEQSMNRVQNGARIVTPVTGRFSATVGPMWGPNCLHHGVLVGVGDAR